jgi:preprotein translocase subunit SecE
MKGLVNYVKEAYAELLHKVSWPTFKELQSSTILVMVASLCFAIVVLAMDLAFENLMKAVYRLLY